MGHSHLGVESLGSRMSLSTRCESLDDGLQNLRDTSKRANITKYEPIAWYRYGMSLIELLVEDLWTMTQELKRF